MRQAGLTMLSMTAQTTAQVLVSHVGSQASSPWDQGTSNSSSCEKVESLEYKCIKNGIITANCQQKQLRAVKVCMSSIFPMRLKKIEKGHDTVIVRKSAASDMSHQLLCNGDCCWVVMVAVIAVVVFRLRLVPGWRILANITGGLRCKLETIQAVCHYHIAEQSANIGQSETE